MNELLDGRRTGISIALLLILIPALFANVSVSDPVIFNGPGLGANFPQGIAYHPIRDTLFVLTDSGKVIEIDRSGVPLNSFSVPFIAGGGDIAYDPDSGGLLVASGALIRRVAPNGSSPSTLLNLTGAANNIEGLAVHPATGNLWIADDSTEQIMEFDRSGTERTRFGTRMVLPTIVEPAGLDFIENDLLLVDDFDGTRSLYRLSTNGTLIQTIANTSTLGITDPEGVAVVGNTEIWIAGDNDNALLALRLGGPAPDLHFAQFGDGEGVLSSQLMLLNPDRIRPALARITLRTPQGGPLQVDLNGAPVLGDTEIVIPAGGLSVLETDGLGPLTRGSVTVSADGPLSGVILFGGVAGVAGVSASQPAPSGFVAPLENDAASGVRVGVAVMNLEDRTTVLTYRLLDSEGASLATRAGITFAAGGSDAGFLDELFPPSGFPGLDLTSFDGLLEVTGDGAVAATVIQTRPGEFATMPVTAIGGGSNDLFFAQFGDGQGLLSSEILLLNLDNFDANARVLIRDSAGRAAQIDLNGSEVAGVLDVMVPGRGLRILRTDGLGVLQSGSVSVSSNNRLAGVILFGGSVGLAGVGSSAPAASGFLAPMVNDSIQQIRVGIAVQNLTVRSADLTFRLLNRDGASLAPTAVLSVAPLGSEARFLDELFTQLDVSDFVGVLDVSTTGQVAATVIQTRPGQFATLPVLRR